MTVVHLSEARSQWVRGKCQHNNFEVDEQLATVECTDCKALLNPTFALLRLAKNESVLGHRIARLQELESALAEKMRCKCEHCGKFTHVRPSKPKRAGG